MATQSASTEPGADRAVGIRGLVKSGLDTLAAVSIVNVLILLISLAVIEFPPEFVGGPFGPLAVGPVVVNSAIAAVGATVVYGVISRYSAQPNRTFVIIASGTLVVSFGMFLAPDLAGAPWRVFAVLAVLHVTAALVIVGVLTRTSSVEITPR